MTTIDIGIVIVNYNTSALLRDCLGSIQARTGQETVKVCVVDNASADDSVVMVRQAFPDVHVIASASNDGFAKANNKGLRYFGFAADGQPWVRYALLLNPDTKLEASALTTMTEFMDHTPAAGAAGPRLILPDGSLDLACRRSFPTPEVSFYRMVGLSKLFPQHPRFGQYNLTFRPEDELHEVDSVVGAFMMVRAEALNQAGLMDEAYFMYGEDLDWAYRIKQCGWKIFYNPEAVVWHVKRAASRRSPRAQIEFFRAMDIFYHNYYAATTPWWLHWLILGGIRIQWAVAALKARHKVGLPGQQTGVSL